MLRFYAKQEARSEGSDSDDAGAAVGTALHGIAVEVAVGQTYQPPDDGESQPTEQEVQREHQQRPSPLGVH